MRYRIPWHCSLNVWLESIAYMCEGPDCTMPCDPVATHTEVAEVGLQWLESIGAKREIIGRPLSPGE